MDALRSNRSEQAKRIIQVTQGNMGKQNKSFEVGDRVLARDYRLAKKSWAKAKVKEARGNNTFVVHTNEGETWKRHTNQLRRWTPEKSEDDVNEGIVGNTQETHRPIPNEEPTVPRYPARIRNRTDRLTYH